MKEKKVSLAKSQYYNSKLSDLLDFLNESVESLDEKNISKAEKALSLGFKKALEKALKESFIGYSKKQKTLIFQKDWSEFRKKTLAIVEEFKLKESSLNLSDES